MKLLFTSTKTCKCLIRNSHLGSLGTSHLPPRAPNDSTLWEVGWGSSAEPKFASSANFRSDSKSALPFLGDFRVRRIRRLFGMALAPCERPPCFAMQPSLRQQPTVTLAGCYHQACKNGSVVAVPEWCAVRSWAFLSDPARRACPHAPPPRFWGGFYARSGDQTQAGKWRKPCNSGAFRPFTL
jgi:hypothetical protein